MADAPGRPPRRYDAAVSERNPWTLRTRKTVYENPWIEVFRDDVVRPDGAPGIYGVVHFRNVAVGIVVLDGEDRTLLVGQYRYPTDHYSWEIPEGGAPLDEDLMTAAQRELQEETGYAAEHWEEILRAELSNSVTDERAIVYLATRLREGDASPEGTEVLRMRWVSIDDAVRMVMDGEITDALSILGLQTVALRRAGGQA